MPTISGFHHLGLTVTDLQASERWYCDVLGFEVHAEIEGERFQRTRLRHPDAGITITLTRHDAGSGDEFTELRTGLDHVALGVPSVAHVTAWHERIEAAGATSSEIKTTRTSFGTGAMITLRDPDGIQLEIVAEGP